jgi:hypothetical protein
MWIQEDVGERGLTDFGILIILMMALLSKSEQGFAGHKWCIRHQNLFIIIGYKFRV